jgi:hypothetical protein
MERKTPLEAAERHVQMRRLPIVLIFSLWAALAFADGAIVVGIDQNRPFASTSSNHYSKSAALSVAKQACRRRSQYCDSVLAFASQCVSLGFMDNGHYLGIGTNEDEAKSNLRDVCPKCQNDAIICDSRWATMQDSFREIYFPVFRYFMNDGRVQFFLSSFFALLIALIAVVIWTRKLRRRLDTFEAQKVPDNRTSTPHSTSLPPRTPPKEFQI